MQNHSLHPLLNKLLNESHSFSFFQAMRLLRALTHQSNEELQNNVAIHPKLSLSFQVSPIDNIDHIQHAINKEILSRLKKDGLQPEMVPFLETLIDRWYTDTESFSQCLDRVIGKEIIEQTIFRVTDASLYQLKKNDISEKVYDVLSQMKNKWLTNDKIFLSVLESLAGKEALEIIQKKLEKTILETLIIHHGRFLKQNQKYDQLLQRLEKVGVEKDILNLLEHWRDEKYEGDDHFFKLLKKTPGLKTMRSKKLFRISKPSIKELQQERISNDIIQILDTMDGLWYTSEAIFKHIMSDLIDEDDVERVMGLSEKTTYKDLLIKHASSIDPEEMKGFSVTTTFLGLYGTSSPLPVFYTTDLINEKIDGESASRDFLNIINRRLYHLLFRCYSKYNPFVKVIEEKDDQLIEQLFCLIGMGEKELRKDIKQPFGLLRYIGLLTQHPKSAIGLQTLLKDALRHLNNIDIKIVQCVNRKATISEDQQLSIGKTGNLGINTFLGSHIDDRMTKFRIQIGPMKLPTFKKFFPGGDEYAKVTTLARLYLTDYFEYDMELIIDDKFNKISWGSSRLGFDTWLNSNEYEKEKRIIFSSRY